MEREREKEDGKAWEGFELIRVFSKSRGKEFLAGIVILILMASLCGCGNPDEEGYSGETNIAQTTTGEEQIGSERNGEETAQADGSERNGEETAQADGSERNGEETAQADGSERNREEIKQADGSEKNEESNSERTASTESREEEMEMKLMIDQEKVLVAWEENEAVEALKDLVADSPLKIELSEYGGFEQVGSIGESIPRNDVRTTTQAGDIVLYSGNQIVVFYGSNTWSYTKLGHITDKSASDLAELLGGRNVTLTISIAK